jgi:hypothetical protein
MSHGVVERMLQVVRPPEAGGPRKGWFSRLMPAPSAQEPWHRDCSPDAAHLVSHRRFAMTPVRHTWPASRTRPPDSPLAACPVVLRHYQSANLAFAFSRMSEVRPPGSKE